MYILYIYVRYDSHKFGGSVTASSKLETPIWGLFSASMESRLRFDHPVLITGPPERWLVAAYKESMCQRPLQTSRRFASLLAINMKGTVLAGGFLGFQIYGTLNVESDGKCRKRIIHIFGQLDFRDTRGLLLRIFGEPYAVRCDKGPPYCYKGSPFHRPLPTLNLEMACRYGCFLKWGYPKMVPVHNGKSC